MQVVVLIISAALTGFYFFISRLLTSRQSSLEPPIISAWIPVMGHILGLLKEKAEYYVHLKKSHGLSIYSLNLAGSIIYVATSIELIKAVQKQHKVLAFPPIAAQFAMIVCASSEKANSILKTNVNGEQGDWGYAMSFYKVLHPSLSPGPALDSMNRIMIQDIGACLERLKPRKGASRRLQLSKWLRHEVTMATTNAVYGPTNPFKDGDVEAAFWNFQAGLTRILINVLPKFTASRACKARDVLVRAFDDYFRRGGHENGSILVQKRYRNSIDNGIPLNDIARYEVGGSIAILANTAPAAFWILLYIFANEPVLRAVREEAATVVTVVINVQGQIVRTLDLAQLKDRCQLLTSVFTEVLRHKTLGISVRKVMQNLMLDGKYLLRKDRILIMPSRVLHTDPDLWGSDVDKFNPSRFVRHTQMEGVRSDPAAFRAFGGGSTLCPGRHFSTTEILAVVAMALMWFDFKPAIGRWIFPTTHKSSIAVAIMEPDFDVDVDVSFRQGFENDEWNFNLADSKSTFAVTAEDRLKYDA